MCGASSLPEGWWLHWVLTRYSESVSTGVWCVPGFGAGFEIALEPSELQKEGENPGKRHFYFLRQTLVCTKPWFKRDLRYLWSPLLHTSSIDRQSLPDQEHDQTKGPQPKVYLHEWSFGMQYPRYTIATKNLQNKL